MSFSSNLVDSQCHCRFIRCLCRWSMSLSPSLSLPSYCRCRVISPFTSKSASIACISLLARFSRTPTPQLSLPLSLLLPLLLPMLLTLQLCDVVVVANVDADIVVAADDMFDIVMVVFNVVVCQCRYALPPSGIRIVHVDVTANVVVGVDIMVAVDIVIVGVRAMLVSLMSLFEPKSLLLLLSMLDACRSLCCLFNATMSSPLSLSTL